MARKKLVAVIKTTEKQYGYEPVNPPAPMPIQEPARTVQVPQYTKKQNPKKSIFSRKRKQPDSMEAAGQELSDMADALERE